MLKNEDTLGAAVNPYVKEKIALEAVFTSSPDGITVFDLNGNITECNEATVRLHGFISREELIGKSAFELISPKDRQRASLLMQEMLKEGSMKNLEVTFLTKDGKEFPAEGSGQVLMDATGNPMGFVTVTRDITERERARKALEESEKRYRELTESISDVFFAIDKNLKCTYWNKASEKLTGIQEREVIGKSIIEVFPEFDDGTSAEEFHRELTKTSQPRHLLKEYKAGNTNLMFEITMYPTTAGFSVFAKDITERKRLEEALHESGERFRQVAENALEWIWEVDSEGLYTCASSAVEKILGYKPEEVVGKKHFYDLFPPENREELMKEASRVIGEKQAFHGFINKNVHKKGKFVWLSTSGVPIFDKKGSLLGYRGTDTDITESKQFEDDLRSSEEKFRAIATSTMDAIVLLDKRDRIIYWNPAAERFFGYAAEEAVGKELGKLVVPPENLGHHLALLEKLDHKDRISEKRLGIKALRKDGTEFPVELSATALKLNDETCILEVIRDVSEVKRMEAAIKQERDMLEAVTDNIGAGLIIISKEYRTLWANGFIKRYKGDVEGKLCFATLNTLDTVCPDCGVKKVFENGVAMDTHEYSSIDINGRPYAVELIATPIKDKDGNVTAALELAVDITEKKEMQTELAEYSQKLEELVEKRTEQLKQTQAKLVKSERLAAIGESAAMVGHDLRNPLQATKNATYHLKTICSCMPSSAIPPKAKEMLQVISDSVDYADKIVRDLHDLSTSQNPLFRKFDINMLVKETLLQIEVPKNVKINTDLNRLPEIEADRDQMKRVFINLITNGMQAMENGGTLTVSTWNKEASVAMTFKDTGVGIPPDNMEKIFRPFFTTKAKGMGVGLAICKKFVESHGGKIDVESVVGMGTTFTVILPVSDGVEVENVDRE